MNDYNDSLEDELTLKITSERHNLVDLLHTITAGAHQRDLVPPDAKMYEEFVEDLVDALDAEKAEEEYGERLDHLDESHPLVGGELDVEVIEVDEDV